MIVNGEHGERWLVRKAGKLRCRHCRKPYLIRSEDGRLLVANDMQRDYDLCERCVPGAVGDIIRGPLAQFTT